MYPRWTTTFCAGLRRIADITFLAAVVTLYNVPFSHAQGQIYAWGNNEFGQCDIPLPNTEFVAVSAGYGFNLGLKSDGTVVAWGKNDVGQCDIPTPNCAFAAVAAGIGHSLGLKIDGSVIAWGNNQSGQCDVPAPNIGFIAIAAGDGHSLGLRFDGSIAAWGDNWAGQCNVPAPNTDFSAIAAGWYHSLGLKSGGTIKAWGYSGDEQCNIEPYGGYIAISASYSQSLGLTSWGTISTWGDHGYTVVPSPNEDFVAIECGPTCIGLRGDGSIVAWRDNSFWQFDIPQPNAGFTAVSSSWGCVIGLKDTATPGFDLPVLADCPDDQGGQIEVSWRKHNLDSVASAFPVTAYEVQRLSGEWQTLATVSATQASSYAVTVSTDDIQVEGRQAPGSLYRVIARTSIASAEYFSLSATGCSIDNLPPAAPQLALYDGETYRTLAWTPDTVQDASESCLYRDYAPGFEAGSPVVCSATQNFYVEDHLARYYYRARSFDIHGNASDWSNEVTGQWPTPVPNAVPTALHLYPCQPNPFNPQTTIKYDLPAAGPVRLSVFDVAGRLVRTLVDDSMPQGGHEAVWDGRDTSGREVGSGSYLARLEFGGNVEVVRMGLVR